MDRKTVYSTAHGRMCPKCGWPVEKCACSKESAVSKGDGIIRVGRETKGRKGKGVTLITGVPLGGDELKALAGELKRKCGTGGTVKDGVIEIQGDHRDQLVEILKQRGYTVKKSGG
jgi:translation initiation factor 1